MAEVKLGYMLETPSIPHYLFNTSENVWMRTISRQPRLHSRESSETTSRASTCEVILHKATVAYLQGSLGDATFNRLHKTYRFSQKDVGWLNLLKIMLATVGQKSWIYKEGRDRNLYVLETTAKFLNLGFDPSGLKNRKEKIAYVRGYFDAEGGIPRSSQDRFYVQFCQKNRSSLEKVKSILKEMKIECGKIHNPSEKTDPE